MSSPSLESKTVRPGSLGSYSYYRSARRPDHPAQTSFIAASRLKLIPKRFIITAVVVAALIGVPLLRSDGAPAQKPTDQPKTQKTQKAAATAPAAATVVAPSAKPDNCDGNTRSKLVLVSISQRHLWACEHAKTVYDSPVITGITTHDSTLTPPGNYSIYGKQTDTRLSGSDVVGSWDYPVSYWMPFLSNQYGIYGFHDATWRPDSEFGNVSPDSSNASHGCVELPLSSMAWLYGWAPTGTAVTIKS
jgi:lipoprotein-anchoring transpeptidase ErfK/SrfK